MNEPTSGLSSLEMEESFPAAMSVHQRDCLIAFLTAVKSVLMEDAPERYMLRRMQSRLPPGLERALIDVNSIALTLPACHAPSLSSMPASCVWCSRSHTATPPDLHCSMRLGLVSSEFLR